MDDKYFIMASSLPAFNLPIEYRGYAEEALDAFGYWPIRIGASFRKKQPFGTYEVYSYSKTKKMFFDDIPLQEFFSIRIRGTNVKGSRRSNSTIGFNFDFQNNVLRTELILGGSSDPYGTLVENAWQFIRKQQKISSVESVVADIMDSDKYVEFFVIGVSYNMRNSFENEVAYSISDLDHKHKKLPYLFAYNYMKKMLRHSSHHQSTC